MNKVLTVKRVAQKMPTGKLVDVYEADGSHMVSALIKL